MNNYGANDDRPVAVYALTGQGLTLAGRLRGCFARADLYAAESLQERESGQPSLETRWFKSLGEVLEPGFHAYSCHIFIAATGIVVRAVAPYLRGKTRDPAVLALDQRGRFVISLLSGHIGGANAMARRIAAHIGAQPVITTATDVEGLPALDQLAVERGLAIANPEAIKAVSAALLAGERVGLCDPENRLGLAGSAWESLFIPLSRGAAAGGGGPFEIAVRVSAQRAPEDASSRVLLLHPRIVHAGIGCRRGAPAEEILAALGDALEQTGLAPAALAALASIEAKREEEGLLEAARRLAVPARFYPPEHLAEYPVSRPSAKVRQTFGIDVVCEPAALASASHGGGGTQLLCEKRVSGAVTVALAMQGNV